MMVVVRVALKFVASHSVAEVAAADEADLLEGGQAAIDGHEVEVATFQALKDLFDAVRPVLFD